MRSMGSLPVAVLAIFLSMAASPSLFAQDEAPALPTLLIPGEVVSVDASDPNAAVLKVKDRYGFETPILLTQDTKITQGDQVLTVADLVPGIPVAVEYNFDVNTAKRYAVLVKVTQPVSTTSPAAAEASVSMSASTETPETSPTTEPASTAATATHEHPGKEHPGETTQ